MDDDSEESTEQDDTTEEDSDWNKVDAKTGSITETTKGMITVIYTRMVWA